MQLQQDILNGRKDKLDLLRVRRARIMRIHLLARRALVETHEPVQQVVTGGIVVVTAVEVREVLAEGGEGELGGEEVDLVEEEDDGGVLK